MIRRRRDGLLTARWLAGQPAGHWLLLTAMIGWPLARVFPGWLPHASVIKSEPKANGTVGSAPSRLRLWFSEKISLSATRVELRGADKKSVKLSSPRVDPEPGDPVTVGVLGALRPGVYRVTWSTVGEDGQESGGFYVFTFASPPTDAGS
jgi:copper resistance protein C